jgi:hypothetical protein
LLTHSPLNTLSMYGASWLLFYYLPSDRLSRLRHKRFPTFSFILDFFFILLSLPSLYWRQTQTTQSIHTFWICIVLAIFHIYLNNGSHKNRIDAKFEWLDDIFKIKLMETSVINVCGCLFCLQIIEDACPVSFYGVRSENDGMEKRQSADFSLVAK